MARVLVLGSSNTDMTVHLARLPVPGETVLGGIFRRGPGGKGANQAVAAARAGGEVTFLTSVGGDAFGRKALEGYAREGIDVSHANICQGMASGVALIFVGDEGENMIGVASGANAALSAADIEGLPDALFIENRLLLIAGLEVPIDAVNTAIARAKRTSMTIILNPAPIPHNLADSVMLGQVDVLTPNRGELALLTGIDTRNTDGLERAARTLQTGSLIVTLGSEGCLIFHKGRTRKIPAHKVNAVDTVGAGDAFNGALAVALAEGRDFEEAAAWATAAAAIAVTSPGAQSALPSREEIDRQARTRYA